MSNDRSGEIGEVIGHYSGVDHEKGPSIYTRADMYDAIFDLGEFQELPRDESNRFVDLMSGVKCLVASAVKERAECEGIPLDIYCLDIAFEGMDEIGQKELADHGYILLLGDITEGTGYESSFFDRSAARFGVKNYPEKTQMRIFGDAKRIMKSGGFFVFADMVSPETSYDWMQEERRRKSKHTVGEENAHYHVPTLGMWFEMLEGAGFVPKKDDVFHTRSYVNTLEWQDSNQMDRKGIKEMNEFLLNFDTSHKNCLKTRLYRQSPPRPIPCPWSHAAKQTLNISPPYFNQYIPIKTDVCC
jgi:hypothetical protein